MTVVLFFVLLFLGLYNKKSKIVFLSILLLMWCMFTFCYDMVDDVTYMSRYENIDMWGGSTELLYKYLIILCNTLGFDFTGFRGVTCLLFTSLVGYTVWKNAKYPNLVMLLFFLYPFPIYTVQIRSALASAIIIFAMPLLFDDKDNKKVFYLTKSDWKYVGLVLVATFIHTQSLFFLLFLLINKMNASKAIKIMVLLNIVLGVVVTPQLLGKVLSLFGAGQRMVGYLTVAYKLSEYRKYGPILYIAFASAITIFSCCYILKNKKRFFDTPQIARLLNLNILMLSIVSIFFVYTSEIYRIQETTLLINYLYLSNTFSQFSLSKIKVKDFKVLTLVFILCIGYLWLSIIHYMYDSVWIPFWFNNHLLM